MAMDQEALYLPAGFTFDPTDEELILHYLLRKVAGDTQFYHVITHTNIYEVEPWNLPLGIARDEKQGYFFSQRTLKYRTGSRPVRTAGKGTWRPYGVVENISGDGDQIIGRKKCFSFGIPNKQNTGWVMDEYELASEIGPNRRQEIRETRQWVLCRVKNLRDYFDDGVDAGASNTKKNMKMARRDDHPTVNHPIPDSNNIVPNNSGILSSASTAVDFSQIGDDDNTQWEELMAIIYDDDDGVEGRTQLQGSNGYSEGAAKGRSRFYDDYFDDKAGASSTKKRARRDDPTVNLPIPVSSSIVSNNSGILSSASTAVDFSQIGDDDNTQWEELMDIIYDDDDGVDGQTQLQGSNGYSEGAAKGRSRFYDDYFDDEAGASNTKKRARRDDPTMNLPIPVSSSIVSNNSRILSLASTIVDFSLIGADDDYAQWVEELMATPDDDDGIEGPTQLQGSNGYFAGLAQASSLHSTQGYGEASWDLF